MDSLGGIINYAEKIHSALGGSKQMLHYLLVSSSKISGASLQVVSEAFHIDVGVMSGDYEINEFLLLFVMQEQVLSEYRLISFELHLL